MRVLAGLIHKIGLIAPEQVNLAGAGLIAYKQFSATPAAATADLRTLTDGGSTRRAAAAGQFDNAAQFARITSSRWPTIDFVGVWDTVASVIVPRPDRFCLRPQPGGAGLHAANPSVKIFRQAIAIDERRCMFRLKPWDDPQDISGATATSPTRRSEPQDILQVWFAGVHCRHRRRLSGSRERRSRNIRCSG